MTIQAHKKKAHDNMNDHRYQKGKFCCRKGMAIELALFVIFVVFACSALMVTSALAAHKTLLLHEQQVVNRSLIDELADRVLADLDLDPTTLGDRFDGYHYRWESDPIPRQEQGEGTARYFASLIIDRDMAAVLTVRVQIEVVERMENSKPSETGAIPADGLVPTEGGAPSETESFSPDAIVIEMKILEWIYH